MKTINAANFRTDPHYERIAGAVRALLKRSSVVRPVDVFVTMGLLASQRLADWQAGRVPYLERVITCNLSKASRILRILRMHAHDMQLRESHTAYRHRGHRLQFSKTGEPKVEEAYSRHFVRPNCVASPGRSLAPAAGLAAERGRLTPDSAAP
jgi:hypothetical protein